MFKFNYTLNQEESGGEAPSGSTGGMMGSPQGEAPAASEGEAPKGEAPAAWAYADGKNGEGDRPEWLKEKYKSVADQAKSYTELEKRFGGFTGSPDEYTDVEGIPTDGEAGIMAATIKDIAKQSNMNQETYEKIVSGIAANIDGYREAMKQEEMNEAIKNIPNFETRRTALADTVQAALTTEQFQGINSLMTTKEGFEAVEALAAQIRGGSLPGSKGNQPLRSPNEIMNDLNQVAQSDIRSRTQLLEELNAVGGGKGKLV